MPKPVVLQVGPLPEWDEGPLSESFDLRRYFEASNKPAYLAEVGPSVRGIATRGDLSRCLERAGRYGEMIDLWVEVYEGNKGAYGSTALWNAIELGVNGGEYQRAWELLLEFEKHFKGRASERRWLHAWLPMRLGDDASAREQFAQMLDTKRTGGQERAITYFLGKLELESDDPELRAQGVARLKGMVDLRDNLNDLVRRYDKDVILVEYSARKEEVHKIVFDIPGGRGKGTCIWEPLNTWEAIFDREGNANDFLKLYDQFKAKYLQK